ncbi:MAG TPA: M23 family metallopeptidase [Candidatus Caccenecus avistercoris]|nr:M23 family metallopeptidase [Candidatus Caccenecus avistercoris]
MDEINDIIRKNKLKREKYVDGSSNTTSSYKENLPFKLKYAKNLISRVLITVIFVLGSIIFTNISEDNKALYQKYVLEDSLEFTKINELYQSVFGDVDIAKQDNNTDSEVVFGDVSYTNIEPFKNGVKLTVGMNEAISVITSGIVVFIGEKDDLGNTVIIQGNDGVDIWYSNITDTDISVYDYIEAGSILGSSNSEDIYLTINKDGEFINYEEYKASI